MYVSHLTKKIFFVEMSLELIVQSLFFIKKHYRSYFGKRVAEEQQLAYNWRINYLNRNSIVQCFYLQHDTIML